MPRVWASQGLCAAPPEAHALVNCSAAAESFVVERAHVFAANCGGQRAGGAGTDGIAAPQPTGPSFALTGGGWEGDALERG